MADLMQTPKTMTSLEIAVVVEKRHDNVKRTIETLGEKGIITLPQIEEVSNPGPGPKMVEVYHVGKRDSFVVVAQLSPEFTARLVDRWQELEAGAAPHRLASTAEQMLMMAQITVDLEREQKSQAKQISGIAAQVEELKQAGAVLPSCPSNAENLTSIRERMRKRYGLSKEIIDKIVRNCPYAPRPLATVRNGHENANNSTYVVFNKMDVTAVFKRFVSECVSVSPKRCTHPFIDGPFQTPKKETV